uniref:Uncharacterized protein n=1 Tax=Octopus bimaculoides TaxID=37653 RepID=A0A0L8ICG4_OCTBM
MYFVPKFLNRRASGVTSPQWLSNVHTQCETNWYDWLKWIYNTVHSSIYIRLHYSIHTHTHTHTHICMNGVASDVLRKQRMKPCVYRFSVIDTLCWLQLLHCFILF